MGRFNYVLGKAEEVKIGDEVFKIKQLGTRHLGLFMNGNGKVDASTIIDMVLASLQQTDETITKEDVEELPLPLFQKIAEVVMKVNELSE